MLKKPVKIFIIFSIIFLLFSILFITLLTFKSIPNYNRVVTSSFVEKDVKIIRNNYAIPNIIGQSNEDTFYALGYVHAQDRLWQMILLRKTAKGKLSEIFGEDYLETDKFMRTLDIYNNSKINPLTNINHDIILPLETLALSLDLNNKLFEKLCTILDMSGISKDPKFSDNSSRSKKFTFKIFDIFFPILVLPEPI